MKSGFEIVHNVGRLDIDDPRRTIYGKTLSQCSVKFHAQDILYDCKASTGQQ